MEKILQVLCTAIDSGRLVKIIFAGKRKKSIEYKKNNTQACDDKR